MKRSTLPAEGLAIALALLLAGGCNSRTEEKAGQMGQGQGPVPVKIAPVLKKDVPVELRNFGTVEAYSTIEVKAQIGGPLIRVSFREGDFVKKEDPLFTIDPRPSQAMLDRAEADLARDKAQLKNAELEVRRLKDLLEASYVSQDDFDKAVTAAEALAATVKADEAAIENARVQLDYCSIRSPIDGRTGRLMANQGNLVKANADSPMVVITQVRPIYVSFTMPERELAEIRRHLEEGKVEVDATVPAIPDRPLKGELSFFSNQVDTSTGTILLKATFENRDLALWPGQYVDVRVLLTIRRGATVVPSLAVQVGQQGSYVFVVKPEGTVEMRPVDVGSTLDKETVILSGLEPGEKVVTEGQLRLSPGAAVEEKTQEKGTGVARR